MGEGMRIAVLASGRGSDFQSIIDAVEQGEVPVEIAVLICNNPGARCVERATKHDIPSHVIDHRGLTREEHEKRILDVLEGENIELIVLAGYMRILTPRFLNAFPQKIINIHPSLLPSFPGAHAHRDVLAHGAKVSGCTVHFVDEEEDAGPIIAQRAVPVLGDDDEEALSQRILEVEHELLPEVVKWIAEDRVRIEGRRVRVR